MRLVGLHGYPGSGKDQAAEALTPMRWLRRAFADPVRRGLLALNPGIELPWEFCQRAGLFRCPRVVRLSWLVEQVGWTVAKTIPEVRELLQRYGTEAGRDIHGPDCWVEIMQRELRLQTNLERVVITDVRFPNEVALIRFYGGELVRVTKPGVGPVNAHVSEQAIVCDRELANDGTLEEWHAKVREAFGG